VREGYEKKEVDKLNLQSSETVTCGRQELHARWHAISSVYVSLVNHIYQ
jgi:hypothetical protein